MEDVNVKKSDLLEKLRANKENHTKLYRDALEGFLLEAKQRLEFALDQANLGNTPKTIHFDPPIDHTEHYNEAIVLLEMSVDEEIQLDRREFNSYVLDKWISDSEKQVLRTYALSSSNAASYRQ